MLSTFRNKLKFWSNVALWPVIIAFIAFYGWSFSGNQQGAVNAAAIVGDRMIKYEDVNQAKERFRRYYQEIYQDNFDRMSKSMDFEELALNSLIDEAILLRQSQELGIIASGQEIKDFIKSTSYFQKNGQFSPQLYNRALQNMRLTPKQYESSVSQSIILSKVRTLLGVSAPVTIDELKESFVNQNVKINCDYYSFLATDFLDGLTVSDEELQDYYGNNMEEFRADDQFKVKFVRFNSEDYQDQVEIFEDDIDQYYNDNYERYQTPEEVRASHILIKVDADSPQENWDAALMKMQEIKQKLDEGSSFEDLAKEYSEDNSATKGGDLGFFSKGKMVKPFENAVWDMEIDEISEPVKSQFGYHLIKKTDYKKAGYKPFDEVEASIESILKKERAKELAMQKAQSFFEKVADLEQLDNLAKGWELETGVTDFFEKSMPPQEIGRSRELDTILNTLEENKISIPVETYKGIFILAHLETKKSHIPPLAEVTDDVRKAVEKKKSLDLAKTKAEELATDLNSGLSWEEAGGKYGLESQSTTEFNQTGYIPRLGSDSDLVDELFSMNVDDISEVKTLANRAIIFKLTSKNEFSEEAFQEELPMLRKQTVASRERQALNSYLQQVREQYKREGLLTISVPEIE